MLDVDKAGQPAVLLCLGYRGQCEGRFARAFRSENLDDAATRKTADAKGAVDLNVSGGNNVNGRDRRIAESANCFAAIVLFDLLDGEVEVLCAHGGGLFINGGRRIFSLRHILEELSGIGRNDKSGTKTNARREGGRCTFAI